MSSRAKRVWLIAGAVVVLLVALNFLAQALDRAAGGGAPSGANDSSYATTDQGLAAYAALLAHFDHTVTRQRGSFADDVPSPDTTVVMVEPTVVTTADTDALLAFTAAGGRLIIGGSNPYYLRNLRDQPPEWSSAGRIDWNATGLGPVREIAAAARGSWVAPGTSTPVVGTGDDSLLNIEHVGRGEIWFLADASPLENAYLSKADNAAFGLALAANRPVVFAEGVHGYGKERGLRAIPTPWKVALLLGVIGVLAFVWSRARRFGPPDRNARELPPARAEYVRSLSDTLERTHDRASALAPTQAYARRRLTQRAALGATPTAEELTRAARDLGCSNDEIAALLAPIGNDEQALALGRVTARVSGSDGRTG